MEDKELRGLSESLTREAYDIFAQVAANLSGGAHMVRVGDGAHIPSERDRSIGLSTAWAVFKGGWPTPKPPPRPNLRSGANRAPAPPTQDWLHEAQAAYGGCLGPGTTIQSGEVAAMVACIREAIALRRLAMARHRQLQLAGPMPEFNVIYGTDSSSCAHEMETHWDAGTFLTLSRSKIASLAETLLHLRRELHALGATFTLEASCVRRERARSSPSVTVDLVLRGSRACRRRPSTLLQASPVEKGAAGTLFGSWRRSSTRLLERGTRWLRCCTSGAARSSRGGCSVPGGRTCWPAPCRPLLGRRPYAS